LFPPTYEENYRLNSSGYFEHDAKRQIRCRLDKRSLCKTQSGGNLSKFTTLRDTRRANRKTTTNAAACQSTISVLGRKSSDDPIMRINGSHVRALREGLV